MQRTPLTLDEIWDLEDKYSVVVGSATGARIQPSKNASSEQALPKSVAGKGSVPAAHDLCNSRMKTGGAAYGRIRLKEKAKRIEMAKQNGIRKVARAPVKSTKAPK